MKLFSQKGLFLVVLGLFAILPNFGVKLAESAALKRLVGETWRVGGRNMCSFFNRNYETVKTLTRGKGPEVYGQFRDLSVQWLNVRESLDRDPNNAALLSQFEHLKERATEFFGGLFGDIQTAAPVMDVPAPMDSIDQEMANLLQRQQMEMQMLMNEVAKRQQLEQQHIHQALQHQREVQNNTVRTINQIKLIFQQCTQMIHHTQSLITGIPVAAKAIDDLNNRIRSFLPQLMHVPTSDSALEAMVAQIAQEMNQMREIAVGNKQHISVLLTETKDQADSVNKLLGSADTLCQQLEEVTAGNPQAMAEVEILLTQTAQYRVALLDQVNFVKSVLPELESRQLQSENLLEELAESSRRFLIQISGKVSQNVQQMVQNVKSFIQSDILPLLEQSDSLFKEFTAGISGAQGVKVLSMDKIGQLRQITDKFANWQNNFSGVRQRADAVVNDSRNLLNQINSIPTIDGPLVDTSPVNETVEQVKEHMKGLRQVFSSLQGQNMALLTILQRQGGMMGAPSGMMGAPSGMMGAPSGMMGAPSGMMGAPSGMMGGVGMMGGMMGSMMGAPQGMMPGAGGMMGAPQGMMMGAPGMMGGPTGYGR